MADLRKKRKGHSVRLKNVDKMVRQYITDKIFDGIGSKGIVLKELRAYCALSEGKKYTISSNCYPCRIIYIKVGDDQTLKIRYEFIK